MLDRRRRREEEARAHFLGQGTVSYLKGDYDSAEVDFRGCLAMDPNDAEALFRLGMTLARASQEAAGEEDTVRNAVSARRILYRALRADLEEKWRWEIGRELARLGDDAPAVESRAPDDDTRAPSEEPEAEVTRR